MRLIFDIVGFQITWWASALGAGAGLWWPGVLVAAVVVALQIGLSKARIATLAAVLAAAALGLIAETAIISTGLIRYAAGWPIASLPPLWLIGLWMVFGTCIEATARMLGANPLLKGAVLGMIVAPPTYWGGERIGALSFSEPIWLPLAVTAVIWAIATPLMMLAYRKAAPAP